MLSRDYGKFFRVWLTHLAPLDGLALWRGNCSVGRCVIVVGAGLFACPWLLVSSKAIRRADVATHPYTELGYGLNPFLVETYLRIAVSAHRKNNIRCERTTLRG